MKQSLFRKLTNKALSEIELNGKVLDLGGEKDASYHKLFKGEHAITTVNLKKESQPDIIFDLETLPLPSRGFVYDYVLLINTLEHIYHYRELLSESFRVLRSGGGIVIVVPFLYYIHPSPNDYFRYTKEALDKMLSETGFSEIEITELGKGAFSSAYLMQSRFIPFPISIFFEASARWFDVLVRALARVFGKKYTGEEYPLGYLVRAKKV